MQRWLKQRWRRARGQTIVLGSVGLFVMVLGVISTLNIGQAVSERIRLQNAADAAAYSLAAEEARLFNFFAFTNRAQVAHYSAAMTVQSYISYLTYVGGVVGSLRDLIWDAESIYQCICDLNIDYPIPISEIYCLLKEAFDILGLVLAAALEGYSTVVEEADQQAADLIEALNLFNRAIWRAQLQQGLMINLLLTSGGYPYVEENDELVDFGLINGFNALFNQLEFNQVFDRGAGLNFSLIGVLSNPSDIWSPRIHDEDNTDDDVQTARAVMTEIANASRWGPGRDSEEHFVTDRSDTAPVPTIYGIASLPADHSGQTRMVSGDDNGTVEPGEDDEVEIDVIRDDSDDEPEYYTGSVIASDDYLYPIGWVGVTIFYAGISQAIGTRVLSDTDGGMHYGYEHSDQTTWEDGTMRLPPDVERLVSANPLELACSLACCTETEETFPENTSDDYEDHEDEIHNWAGITAYPKDQPEPEETNDYGQPSTWVFLNLPPDNFNRARSSRGQQPWSLDFDMEIGSRTASLDTTPGVGDSALFSFLEGLNAISRGQAYYHRPRPVGEDEDSNWQEHPNFFNPFWHARLAPVGQKLVQLYNELVSDELHADDAEANPVLAGGINLVRNFLGDTFFHTVTSVMTH
jgi:hypothetical protein